MHSRNSYCGKESGHSVFKTLVNKPLTNRAFIHGPNIRTDKPNPKEAQPNYFTPLHRASTLHFTLQNHHSVTAQNRTKQSKTVAEEEMVAMATTTKRIETYEDFAKVHGILLAASGLPESLHRRLFHKLSTETFDGGEHFQIEPCEENRMRRLVLTSDSMAKDSNVFLVDHAWTFRLSDAYKQVSTFFFAFMQHYF